MATKVKPKKSAPAKAKGKKPAGKKSPAKKSSAKKSPAKKSAPKKTDPKVELKAEPRKREEVVMDNAPEVQPTAPAVTEAPVTAPAVAEAPATAPTPAETIVEVLSSKPQAVNSKALQSYSSAILSTVRKHFRPHTMKEISDLLKGAKYPFHYAIKSRGEDAQNQIFIELTDGSNTERCPIDPADFITING